MHSRSGLRAITVEHFQKSLDAIWVPILRKLTVRQLAATHQMLGPRERKSRPFNHLYGKIWRERVGFEPTVRLPVQRFSRPRCLRQGSCPSRQSPATTEPREPHDQGANNAGCESPQPPLQAAQAGLADRIAEYRPLAIVTLLLSLKEIVEAAIAAGVSLDAMARIVPAIPRAK
jgi:hypothetical protein